MFGEHQADELRCAGAERRADGECAAFADRTRRQEVRHVRTGDHQHAADDDEEQHVVPLRRGDIPGAERLRSERK